MKKIAICLLALAGSAFAQFPGPSSVYGRVLADTIPDSALMTWQMPPFTGVAQLRSMTWKQLSSDFCGDSNYTGTGACVRAISPTITTPTLSGTTNSGKIVSSDTLVGLGIRAASFNKSGLAAQFGGKLLVNDTIVGVKGIRVESNTDAGDVLIGIDASSGSFGMHTQVYTYYSPFVFSEQDHPSIIYFNGSGNLNVTNGIKVDAFYTGGNRGYVCVSGDGTFERSETVCVP